MCCPYFLHAWSLQRLLITYLRTGPFNCSTCSQSANLQTANQGSLRAKRITLCKIMSSWPLSVFICPLLSCCRARTRSMASSGVSALAAVCRVSHPVWSKTWNEGALLITYLLIRMSKRHHFWLTRARFRILDFNMLSANLLDSWVAWPGLAYPCGRYITSIFDLAWQ